MFFNTFIWCDLSTFELAKASDFYHRVFQWSGRRLEASSREDDYTLFLANSRESAGIYTMPEFFQNIGMPSFWMSYIRVESLAQSVKLAFELGAKCEIEPTPFDASSSFALIRDPSGAGFTLYEGPDLLGRDQEGSPGRMIWNELHIPSLSLVEEFYRNLFGWDIVPDEAYSDRHIIKAASGDAIASILELDEASKGPKNYWAVIFATADVNATLRDVLDAGGSLLMEPSAGFEFTMATDDQGAMFCMAETNAE